MLVVGVPHAVWPYKLARFKEQMDSIGSKRSWDEVEPADWKVTLTRVLGVGMAGVGLLGIVATL
jgi:hypothetical protein